MTFLYFCCVYALMKFIPKMNNIYWDPTSGFFLTEFTFINYETMWVSVAFGDIGNKQDWSFKIHQLVGMGTNQLNGTRGS